VFSVWVDSSPPVITLVSPSEGAFVSPTDSIILQVEDACFASVEWSLWGETRTSIYSDVSISLLGSPGDGYFSVPVTATDLAGNSASSVFVFALDSSKPEVSVLGIDSGDALLPGTILEVLVEDAFLSTVEWTWDAAGYSTLSSPYAIDTSDIVAGWQLIQVKAYDPSGKVGWANLSVYFDINAPSVSVQSGSSITSGEPFVVSVLVTDDYCVDLVELSYELVDGTFATVPMALEGMFYMYSLSPDLLWDNMTICVTASDTVGNTAQSASLVLDLMESPPADDGEEDDGGVGANESSMPWMYLGAAAAAGASLLILVLYLRRRAGDEPGTRPRGAAPVKVQSSAHSHPARSTGTVPKPSAGPGSPRVTRGLEFVEKR